MNIRMKSVITYYSYRNNLNKKNTMKYPRYTKEENKSCKLTQEQINEIQELYVPKIFWMRKVAKEMNLPFSTVRYWCLSDEQRKEFNIMKSKYNKPINKEDVKMYNEDRKQRKWKKFTDYISQLKKDYLEKPWVRKHKSEYMKKYYIDNPEKVNPKQNKNS